MEKAPGPGAGPHRDREPGRAGLSWLRGCLVHLRPASWQPVPLAHPLGPSLRVFPCPRPSLCLVATALPVSQAPACQCFSPLGRDKTASCLSTITWRAFGAPHSSSLAAAMREFHFLLALEARWSKDPLPGGKGLGVPPPLWAMAGAAVGEPLPHHPGSFPGGCWGHGCARCPQHLHRGGNRAQHPGSAPASCQVPARSSVSLRP